MSKVSPLRVGLVGVGMATGNGSPTNGAFRIGYLHAKALELSKSMKLVAAADISEPNLKAFQDNFEVEQTYTSLQSMLEQVELDVVNICTYVGLHLDMIEACAHAGIKGIVCEKPVVLSPKELTRLRDIVKSTGVKLIVPHFRRYLPAFVKARDVYTSGQIGAPVCVTAAIGDEWDLSEWGSHWLDMFRFFHGGDMPKWVMGQARVRDRRGFGHAMEDHASVNMQFPDGGRATLEVGPSYLGDQINMVLVGTRGSIVVRDEVKTSVYSEKGEEQFDFSDPDVWQKEGTPGVWAQMFDDFGAWINGGAEAPLGFTHTSGSAELNLACYMSMVHGDRIDFPMQSSHAEWPVEELARRNSQSVAE